MKSKSTSILLAEDDEDDRFFFKKALGELPFDYILNTVSDGEELMNLLTQVDFTLPDVLFLDLNMPLKNGFECLEEIKQNIKFKSLRVIIFSTSFDLKVVKELYEQGASYYLRKPNTFGDLKLYIYKTLTLLQNVDNEIRNEQSFVITL